MSNQSDEFNTFVKMIALRRGALLKENGINIFPPSGSEWIPNNRQQALCDSFIVLFVAELEVYLEQIIGKAMDFFKTGLQLSVFSAASPATAYIEAVVKKKAEWERNNNTNWSRISEYIKFVGLRKSDFSDDLWDMIEQIASERGGIVHNSIGARILKDPRITISACRVVMKNLAKFDKDANTWLLRFSAEIERIRQNPVRFSQ